MAGGPSRTASALQRFASQLDGPATFSVRVFLFELAFVTTSTFVNALSTAGSRASGSTLLAFLPAIVAAAAVFFGFGFVVRRLTRPRSGARTVLTLLVFAATNLCRGLIFFPAAVELGVWPTEAFAIRMVTAVSTGLFTFPLLAIVINHNVMYRGEKQALVQQQHRLARLVVDSQQKWANARQEIVDDIRAQLRHSLAAAVEEQVITPEQLRHKADALWDVADNVVRPLSASLVNASVTQAEEAVVSQPPRLRFGKVLHDALRLHPFQPAILIAATVFIDAPAFIFMFNPGQQAWALGAVFWTWIVLFAARQTLRNVITRGSVVALTVLVIAVYVISSLPTAYFLYDFVGKTAGSWGSFLFVIVINAVVLAAGSLYSGLLEARATTLRQMSDVNEQLAWLVARTKGKQWVERNAAALALHGKVQASLYVAGMKMYAALETDQKTDEAHTYMQQTVHEMLDFLIEPPAPKPLSDTRAEMESLWDGQVQLVWEASTHAVRLLDADEVSSALFRELVSEFILNSVKHVQARNITIELTQHDDRFLSVLFEHPTPSIAPGSGSGMGTALSQAVLVQHSLEIGDEGARLSGLLPVGAAELFVGYDQ